MPRHSRRQAGPWRRFLAGDSMTDSPMTLDVVVPTYNRSELLRKTILSLLTATVPEGLEVSIVVVDNRSSDRTAEVVKELQSGAGLPLIYVLEHAQGSSAARNAGIAASKGQLIG